MGIVVIQLVVDGVFDQWYLVLFGQVYQFFFFVVWYLEIQWILEVGYYYVSCYWLCFYLFFQNFDIEVVLWIGWDFQGLYVQVFDGVQYGVEGWGFYCNGVVGMGYGLQVEIDGFGGIDGDDDFFGIDFEVVFQIVVCDLVQQVWMVWGQVVEYVGLVGVVCDMVGVLCQLV